MEYIIYKISFCDENNNFCYIGSTKNFTNRKYAHKQNTNTNNTTCKSFCHKLYTTIRANGGWNNFEMLPVEQLICSKMEARIRENYHILEQKANLNMVKAYISGDDKLGYMKQYKLDHK